MNGGHILGVGIGSLLIGCSSLLGPDPARIAALERAIGDAEPRQARELLVRGSVEAGSVRFGCAQAFDSLAGLDPSRRAAILAEAFGDWTLFCPTPCAGDLRALSGLAPPERIAATLAQCDRSGPDPVFDGPLAGLRPSMAPMDYLAARALAEIAEGASPSFASLRPKLAVGLVLEEIPADLAPAAELSVASSRDIAPESLTELQSAIRACGPDTVVAHRVVLDPDGSVAGVAGPDAPCVVEALEALTLPPPDGGYTVLDLAWKPEPPKRGGGRPASMRPVIDGPATQEELDRVIRVHLGQIRYCYERQLGRSPSLAGDVVVRFVVAPSGRVSDARTISSTVRSRDLERCLETMFERLTFPPASAPVTVSWPMHFVPS